MSGFVDLGNQEFAPPLEEVRFQNSFSVASRSTDRRSYDFPTCSWYDTYLSKTLSRQSAAAGSESYWLKGSCKDLINFLEENEIEDHEHNAFNSIVQEIMAFNLECKKPVRRKHNISKLFLLYTGRSIYKPERIIWNKGRVVHDGFKTVLAHVDRISESVDEKRLAEKMMRFAGGDFSQLKKLGRGESPPVISTEQKDVQKIKGNEASGDNECTDTSTDASKSPSPRETISKEAVIMRKPDSLDTPKPILENSRALHAKPSEPSLKENMVSEKSGASARGIKSKLHSSDEGQLDMNASTAASQSPTPKLHQMVGKGSQLAEQEEPSLKKDMVSEKSGASARGIKRKLRSSDKGQLDKDASVAASQSPAPKPHHMPGKDSQLAEQEEPSLKKEMVSEKSGASARGIKSKLRSSDKGQLDKDASVAASQSPAPKPNHMPGKDSQGGVPRKGPGTCATPILEIGARSVKAQQKAEDEDEDSDNDVVILPNKVSMPKKMSVPRKRSLSLDTESSDKSVSSKKRKKAPIPPSAQETSCSRAANCEEVRERRNSDLGSKAAPVRLDCKTEKSAKRKNDAPMPKPKRVRQYNPVQMHSNLAEFGLDEEYMVPRRLDGTLDMRFAMNKGVPNQPLESRSLPKRNYGWVKSLNKIETSQGSEQDRQLAEAAKRMQAKIRLQREKNAMRENARLAATQASRKKLEQAGWDDQVLRVKPGEPYPDIDSNQPYKCLGLPAESSKAEVRKRYRKLALMFHPDKNPSTLANKAFCAFSNAYRVLTH